MTGYGRAECQKDDYTYLAEVRSVNNRFIEINTRLPKAHMDLEPVSYTHLTLPTICSV